MEALHAAAPSLSRWPDPGALDGGAIDRLFAELRDERERLMRDIMVLEARAADQPCAAAALDLMEARVGLNALMGYGRLLLARTLALQDWPPLGSAPPRFAELRTGNGWREARARVPLTPDSLLFVHGPVTLWHAAALAEPLLEPGDRLTRLVRCGFRRELTVEPHIIVWDAALGAPPIGCDAGSAAVDGEFETEAGRSIAFAALPDGGAVPTQRATWHPITAHIVASRPVRLAEPAAFAQRLTGACRTAAGAIERSSAVLLAKVEAFVAVLTQHILVGERLLLLARVPDFAIDADFGAWLATSPELQFEIDWKRQKPIPGRGAFVPMRYRALPTDAAWQRSVFICLDSHLAF